MPQVPRQLRHVGSPQRSFSYLPRTVTSISETARDGTQQLFRSEVTNDLRVAVASRRELSPGVHEEEDDQARRDEQHADHQACEPCSKGFLEQVAVLPASLALPATKTSSPSALAAIGPTPLHAARDAVSESGVSARPHRVDVPGSGRRGDDVADAGGGAGGGVEVASSLGEGVEVGAQRFEFGDAFGEFGRTLFDEVEHVRAWCFPSFAERDDFADLAERQSDGLGGARKDEAVEDLGFVTAVAVRFTLGGSEDPDPFVMSNRLDRDAGPVGDVADTHDGEGTP